MGSEAAAGRRVQEFLLNVMAVLLPSLASLCTCALTEKICQAPSNQKEPLLNRLSALRPSSRGEIFRRLDLSFDIELAGVWIDDEAYWRRRFESNWPPTNIQRHGDSWKQAFFERLVRERIEEFDSAKENITSLQRLLSFSRRFIRSLEIHKLPSHLDLELVFDALGNGPSSLVLRYGPGDVGMDYERTLFGMKLSDSRCLMRVLECSELLTSLDISNNLLDDDKLRILCSGLLDNISLTQLNLSKNRISDRGARALAKVLQSNAILTDCDLSDNCIFLDGAKAIARGLKANRTLTRLNLCLNRLGDEGTKVILEAAMGHPSLSYINVSANSAAESATQALCRLVKADTALRFIGLSGNDCSVDGEAIYQALQENGTLEELHILSCGLREDLLVDIEECLLQRVEKRHARALLSP